MDGFRALVQSLASPQVLYPVAVLFTLLVVASLIGQHRKRRRRRELKEEYDRVVLEQVGARQAPSVVPAEVVVAPARSGLRSLDAAEREKYADDWAALQASFVEFPAAAVTAADSLIVDVMRSRGYPLEKFPQLPDVVATYHPHAAANFRAAHTLARGNRAQGAHLELLRQSFMHQRTLFQELLDNVQHIDLTKKEPRAKVPYHRWFREVDHQ